MIPVALSFLLSGLAAFALLCAFAALVPRVAGDGKSLVSVALQYVLIVAVVLPAIAIAVFGPLWLYEVAFGHPTTKDLCFWLLFGGTVLLVACLIAAATSTVGRRYFSWQSRVAN
jgi:hypothetical protein